VTTALISLEDVTKIYNAGQPDEVAAVSGASVSIEKGQVVALKGPSGSGKTTLLSLVGCMCRPTSGRVVVGGRDVAKLPERFLAEVRRRTFGFVFQHFQLLKGVSVEENVLLPLYPSEVGFAEMRRRAEAVLTKLRIWDKRRVRANRLSGGEQQRVAIARALIQDPEIIVADEPTAHLDRRLATEFLETLALLNREGKTIVIATHDPFVVQHPLVGRVVDMRDGRIEGEGARGRGVLLEPGNVTRRPEAELLDQIAPRIGAGDVVLGVHHQGRARSSGWWPPCVHRRHLSGSGAALSPGAAGRSGPQTPWSPVPPPGTASSRASLRCPSERPPPRGVASWTPACGGVRRAARRGAGSRVAAARDRSPSP